MVSARFPTGRLRGGYFVGLVLCAGIAACTGVLGIGNRTLDPELADGGSEAAADVVLVDSNVADSGRVDSSAVDSGDSGITDSAMPVDVGPCGNTQTNGQNCGRCGHDCLGGACEGGVCQPVTLASNIEPWNLAVDDASVYWTNPFDGFVTKADKSDGGNPVTLLSSSAPGMKVLSPFDITLDTTNLYVTDEESGYMLSCALGGCGNNPKALGIVDAGSAGAFKIATDSTFVYCTDTSSGIWRAPKSGAGAATLLGTYTAGGNSSPYDLVVGGAAVYFTNTDGTVQKLPVAGGSPMLVATALSQGVDIILANGDLYWTSLVNPGSVESVPLAGGTPTPVAVSQPLPFGIAADANNLYWLNIGPSMQGTDGTVMTCPLTNCASPTVLASGLVFAKSVVVDDVAVYWTTAGNGSAPAENGAVTKVAKP